jgi:predicted O-methyltransferase YrrM
LTESNPFLRFARPGDFYSPVPDIRFIEGRRERIFGQQPAHIPGIEDNVETQLSLVETFSAYYPDMPFSEEQRPGRRYYFENPYFSYADAIVLYSIMRHFQPRNIIEVGCGYSSAAMLDTNDLFLSSRTTVTFVEPFPDRLRGLMTPQDTHRHEIIDDIVQDVPIERFRALDAGDILFIDSSHVAKIGSDVVYLMTEVLPQLRPGVLIHFHDVFWPFEYPEEWIHEGRAWNEAYMLKAFLQFNPHFRILYFCSYLALHYRAVLEQHLPLVVKNTGGSLWLETTPI